MEWGRRFEEWTAGRTALSLNPSSVAAAREAVGAMEPATLMHVLVAMMLAKPKQLEGVVSPHAEELVGAAKAHTDGWVRFVGETVGDLAEVFARPGQVTTTISESVARSSRNVLEGLRCGAEPEMAAASAHPGSFPLESRVMDTNLRPWMPQSRTAAGAADGEPRPNEHFGVDPAARVKFRAFGQEEGPAAVKPVSSSAVAALPPQTKAQLLQSVPQVPRAVAPPGGGGGEPTHASGRPTAPAAATAKPTPAAVWQRPAAAGGMFPPPFGPPGFFPGRVSAAGSSGSSSAASAGHQGQRPTVQLLDMEELRKLHPPPAPARRGQKSAAPPRADESSRKRARPSPPEPGKEKES